MNIFKFFTGSDHKKPQDVKELREAILSLVRKELRKMEGGEGIHIKGIKLFIACQDEERHLYDSATYLGEEARFKDEVQKVADDFALDLPEKWTLDINFVEQLPAETAQITNLCVGLSFTMPQHKEVIKSPVAYLKIINGEAEKPHYSIRAENGRINLGRERKTLDQGGFLRENHIAFPDESGSPINKYISRQHAHIEWNNDTGAFTLFADEGGIPPRNKVKVKSIDNHNPIKLTFTEFGYPLAEGDQIILGESAVLLFSYSPFN